MLPIDDDDSGTGPGQQEGWGSFVPDFVKRMAVAGLGALFMTEEGIRNLAGQLKLPKEVLGFILAQAERTKTEIGRAVSEELRRFLQSERVRDEFLKLLTSMTVEVKAEVRLVPADGARTEPTPASAQGAPEGVEAPSPALTPKVSVSSVTARRGRKKRG